MGTGEKKDAEFNKRLRLLTWEDYEISQDRYQELKHFCRQYKEKKKRVLDAEMYGIKAAGSQGSGTGGEHISDPTANQAIRNAMRAERDLQDCNIIESSAMWAAGAGGYPKAWKAILASVTDGTNYERVAAKYSVPFGKTDFYAVRRAFYHKLDTLQVSPEKSGTN